MSAGDAQRVWFTEMTEELKSAWSRAMTWEDLADFCHRMTEIRRNIRETRGIKPPRMRCPKCGKVSMSEISGISIRSALFALKNNGIITEAELKHLDKSWMRHKAKHGLDRYGRKVETLRPASDKVDPCC
jgi:hypothetical protein